MYRLITPDAPQELPHRMLFHPSGDSLFLHAVEADTHRALVAALIGDPDYETAGAEDRLLERLRVANDAALLLRLQGQEVTVSDRDGRHTINVASDEPLLNSLDRLGVVSLAAPTDAEPRVAK